MTFVSYIGESIRGPGGPSVRPLTHAMSRFRAVGKSHDASYFPLFHAKGNRSKRRRPIPSHDGMHMQSQPQEKIYVFKGHYLKAEMSFGRNCVCM